MWTARICILQIPKTLCRAAQGHKRPMLVSHCRIQWQAEHSLACWSRDWPLAKVFQPPDLGQSLSVNFTKAFARSCGYMQDTSGLCPIQSSLGRDCAIPESLWV